MFQLMDMLQIIRHSSVFTMVLMNLKLLSQVNQVCPKPMDGHLLPHIILKLNSNLEIFYKTLIEIESSDKVEKYTNEIYEKFSKESKDINELLTQIKSLKDIPIELLSKYYIRAYTMESIFYTDINKDLGLNKKQNHLPFIKTLYEGTKLKSLSLASNNKLYRGAKIANDEIDKIKHYLKKKIENLPASIVFSKSFLSISKEKEIAESYLGNKNNNKNLSKVLYILEKDDNVD